MKKTISKLIHSPVKSYLLVAILFFAYLTYAFATVAEPESLKVFANLDGRTTVSGVTINAIAVSGGTIIQSCTTDSTGLCRFSYSTSQTYFVGHKDGVTYGGLANPNYGCKKVTYQYDINDGVYQYVDGVKGEKLTPYGTGIYAESFYSTVCNVTTPPTFSGQPPAGVPPVSTSQPTSPQPSLPNTNTPPAGSPASNEEDLVQEDEEPSDIDIVLGETKNPMYGKPARKPHTPAPDPRARSFQFTTKFNNTDSVAHMIEFSTYCTAINGQPVAIAITSGAQNIRPGIKSLKHTLPVLDAQLSFVEELKRSHADIRCIFEVTGLSDDDTLVPDADTENNKLDFTMAFGRNGKLKIISQSH